jgi:hypothetical protein
MADPGSPALDHRPAPRSQALAFPLPSARMSDYDGPLSSSPGDSVDVPLPPQAAETFGYPAGRVA